MLDAADGPIGVAFVCQRRSHYVTASDWFEIELPCTGMVPATWPLAALLLGAGGAAIVSCSANGCDLGHDERVSDSIALAKALLASAGVDSARVSGHPGLVSEPLAEGTGLHDPFGVHGPAEVVLALEGASSAAQPISAKGPAARLGVVEIDTSVCTLCLACTETCPTGALAHDRSNGQVAVTFDASSCTACAQCVPVCPELERGAIRLRHRVDSAQLAAGRRSLAESTTMHCESCGQPIASTAMLNRIGSILGEEHAATVRYLKRRCMDCRGAGVSSPL
jgi:ferredoxin